MAEPSSPSVSKSVSNVADKGSSDVEKAATSPPKRSAVASAAEEVEEEVERVAIAEEEAIAAGD